LKVVREAQVFWASFSLKDMRCLILFMGTLVSVLVPVRVVGALVPLDDEVGAGFAAGVSCFFSTLGYYFSSTYINDIS
jgi:hypothetical protein